MEGHRNNFDLLRLAAALQVVVLHGFRHLELGTDGLPGLIHRVVGYFPGVPIFFVVSGFLIAGSWERSPDLGRYARSRLLRIYPALWVAFAAALLIAAAWGAIGAPSLLSTGFWAWTVGQLSFVQFYNPPFLRDFGVGVINGSLWTIPVELAFYLAIPILYRTVVDRGSRRGDAWLIGLAVASFLSYAIWLGRDHDGLGFGVKLLSVSLVPHFHMFALGMLLHRRRELVTRWLEGRALAWAALFLATMIGFDLAGLGAGAGRPLMLLAQRLLLAAFTISAALTGRGLARWVLRGADPSYGVYLYHMLVINVLVQAGMVASYRYLAAALVAALVLGTLSWFVVEAAALKRKGPARARPASIVATRPGPRVEHAT
ncbi:MAG: acyltransferase family protein [Gemmatimonadales bacterium]